MKKILYILLLISATAEAQRSIPRGGTAGQVLKIGSDGYSVQWKDSNDSTSNAPLYFADVATTASLSVTYSNGTLTATSNGRIANIDGVALDTGSTILYKNAVSQLQNGIYYVLDTGTVGSPYKLVRDTSYNQTEEIYPSQVNIINGSVNGGAYFLQTTYNPTIGTSAIVYTSKPAPSMVGGTGVTVNTNTISIGQPVGTTNNVTFRSINLNGASSALNLRNAGVNYIQTTNPAGYLALGTTAQSNVIAISDTRAIINGKLVLNSTHTVTAVASATIGGNNTGDARITPGSNISVLNSGQSFTVSTVNTPTFTSVSTNTITATTYNGIPYQFFMACSNETSAITTTDTNSITIYAPFNFTVTSVFGMLRDAQSSGSTFTFDIKKNGTSIFSTRPTIDNTEFTTLTAATAAVLSTTTFAAGDRIVVNRHQVGTGAKGFKVAINYIR